MGTKINPHSRARAKDIIISVLEKATLPLSAQDIVFKIPSCGHMCWHEDTRAVSKFLRTLALTGKIHRVKNNYHFEYEIARN